jgi:hypothetical protein
VLIFTTAGFNSFTSGTKSGRMALASTGLDHRKRRIPQTKRRGKKRVATVRIEKPPLKFLKK